MVDADESEEFFDDVQWDIGKIYKIKLNFMKFLSCGSQLLNSHWFSYYIVS